MRLRRRHPGKALGNRNIQEELSTESLWKWISYILPQILTYKWSLLVSQILLFPIRISHKATKIQMSACWPFARNGILLRHQLIGWPCLSWTRLGITEAAENTADPRAAMRLGCKPILELIPPQPSNRARVRRSYKRRCSQRCLGGWVG